MLLTNNERMESGSRPTGNAMKEDKDCLEELQRIGLRISYFRRVKGLTQADLAETVHINKNYLSHIECGVGKAISLPLLIRISKALDIKLSVLVDLEDWTSDAEKNSDAIAIQELREMMKEMCQLNSDLDRMMAQMDDFENSEEDDTEEEDVEDTVEERPDETISEKPSTEGSSNVIDVPIWMRKRQEKK